MNRSLLTSKRPDWNTPPEVLRRVCRVGRIALDPCGNDTSIVPARLRLTASTLGGCGLAQQWHVRGLVYVNPPYGRAIADWVNKIDFEAQVGTEIVALLPARIDTKWFAKVWRAPALCFWRGRITFLGADSGAPFPSVVAYWGQRVGRFASAFHSAGHLVLQ